MTVRGHHLLYEKVPWRAHDPNKKLREKHSLIIPLHDDEHTALHRKLSMMPVPSHRLGRSILGAYKKTEGEIIRPLDGVEQFLFATQEAVNNPSLSVMDKKIGELLVYGIVEQIPFIKSSLDYGVPTPVRKWA